MGKYYSCVKPLGAIDFNLSVRRSPQSTQSREDSRLLLVAVAPNFDLFDVRHLGQTLPAQSPIGMGSHTFTHRGPQSFFEKNAAWHGYPMIHVSWVRKCHCIYASPHPQFSRKSSLGIFWDFWFWAHLHAQWRMC